MSRLVSSPNQGVSIGSCQPAPPPDLIVSLAPEDVAFCQEALRREHSLGTAQPAGQRLWQIVRCALDGSPVAVLLWAASALHLKDRDAWIGWDGMRRSQRLGLIVNNSRFLVLEAARQGNLASKALGAALRALPAQWREVTGYAPLLAEAFTDLEAYEGTSYKASNWIALGVTKGFERRHRAEFYVLHDRPKKLWVYALHERAREWLCAAELPAEYRAAVIAASSVRSPLKLPEMRSLMDVFAAIPDPRMLKSRRYSLPLMLMLVCHGLLCGAVNLNGILRQVKLLSQVQRRALGLRKKPGKEFRTVPCYNAFRELLAALEVGVIEGLLTRWLNQHEGHLPRTLAVDGKDLGKNLGIIVSLINTTNADQGSNVDQPYDGSRTPPVALKCGDKGQETRLVRELLESVELVGATVTGDALQCNHETLHTIVAQRGGSYLVGLKNNQPKAAEYARKQLDGSPPFA